MTPERPQSVPVEAQWNVHENEWELGTERAGKKNGTWRWWRPDGTLVCIASYDSSGALHGQLERFHPSGQLAASLPYVHGKPHGSHAWLKSLSGPSPERAHFGDAPKETVRLEMAYVGGTALPKIITLYNQQGALDPVPCNEDGLSLNLGVHLHKLLAGTVLSMIVDELPTLEGATLDNPMDDTLIVYGGAHAQGGHTVTLMIGGWSPTSYRLSSEAITRGFTLATQHWLHRQQTAAAVANVKGKRAASRRAELAQELSSDPSANFAALFRHAGKLGTKKGKAKFRCALEERAYGTAFPSELRALLELQERHALGDLHDFRPFFFGPFFPKSAAQLLREAREAYWPVYYRAHFWGLYPFASSTGGDYYLAHLDSGRAHCRVYSYDHEEQRLLRARGSIGELLWDAALGEEAGDPPKQLRSSKAAIPALWDPMVLIQRDEWVTDLLKGDLPEDFAELTAKAPAFSAWKSEKALLGSHPHLALYWVAHHALAGNEKAFAEAARGCAKSKHALVRSMAKLLSGFVRTRHKSPKLASFEASALKQLVERLDQELPARLLEPERVRARAARAKAQAAADEKARARVRTDDPWAAIAALPRDVTFHRQVLKKVAKQDGALAAQIAIFERISLGRLDLSDGVPDEARPLLDAPDARLLVPMIALVRSGLGLAGYHKRAYTALLRPIARIGTDTALELFAELCKTTLDSTRSEILFQCLAPIDDVRVVEFAVEVLQNPEQYLAHDDALTLLAARAPERAQPFVAQKLMDAPYHAVERLAMLARLARLTVAKEAAPALVQSFEKRSGPDYGTWSASTFRALAVLDPVLCRQTIDKWWPEQTKGELRTSTMLLGGLIIAPDEERFLSEARRILSYRGVGNYELDSVRFVLIGIQDGKVTALRDAVEHHLVTGLDLPKDTEQAAAVREVAKDAWEVLGGGDSQPLIYDKPHVQGLVAKGQAALLRALVHPRGLFKARLVAALEEHRNETVTRALGAELKQEVFELSKYAHGNPSPFAKALIESLGKRGDPGRAYLDALLDDKSTAENVRKYAHKYYGS
jgi:hypothetical protein